MEAAESSDMLGDGWEGVGASGQGSAALGVMIDELDDGRMRLTKLDTFGKANTDVCEVRTHG